MIAIQWDWPFLKLRIAQLVRQRGEEFVLARVGLGMPRMSGHEVCRRLRQTPWGKGVKVIALTGWGQQQDRCKSEEAGFDGHLVKPVDPAILSEVLAAV